MGNAITDISPPMHAAPSPERIPCLITTRSAAALLHCSPRNVRKLKDAGRLTPRQYEGFGNLLFDLDEVVALARSGYERERPKISSSLSAAVEARVMRKPSSLPARALAPPTRLPHGGGSA